MPMYEPIIERPSITFTDDDVAELRRVCATTEADDEIVKEMLEAVVLGSGGYTGRLNRSIVRRVITQYYADKAPRLYLWGKQIVAADGYPIVSVWQNNAWTTVDSANYAYTPTRAYANQSLLFINFNNQTWYDSLDLQPDGFSRRVRVEYLTTTNTFADLPRDLKMLLMLQARHLFDNRDGANRQDTVDRFWIRNMWAKYKHGPVNWYPVNVV